MGNSEEHYERNNGFYSKYKETVIIIRVLWEDLNQKREIV